MRRIVLIDGDIVAYRCGFAAEKKRYYVVAEMEGSEVYGPQELVFDGKRELNEWLKANADKIESYETESELIVEPLKFVLSTVKSVIDRIVADTKSTEYEVYLSPSDNFRQQVATIADYKGNRKDTRKAMHHDAVIKYLRKFHNAVMVDNMEADDILAERHKAYTEQGIDSVIASDDKDLIQIPGKHYNIRTTEKKNVSPETGLKRLYIQALTGDRSDNIPGIYKVGEKTAEKILADTDPKMYLFKVRSAWDEYFQGEHKPDWLLDYDPDTGDLTYTDRHGDERRSTLNDIVDEIIQLVHIGVMKHG